MALGIMFHHFYGKGHKKSVGSINKSQFKKILNYINKNFNLLNAEEFISRAIKKKLQPQDVCLTFDDNLKCQHDIALPILKKEKISAFFFIYSSVFDKKFNLMEIIRDFSNEKFKDFNEFYNLFEKTFIKFYKQDFAEFKKKFKSDYLINYSFYSIKERKYRFIRDRVIDQKKFEKILLQMMRKKNYKIYKNYKKIFMNKKHILNLIKNKNIIGLHSHFHYPNLKLIKVKDQITDYKKNYEYIKKNFRVNPISASYPFGRFNSNTLNIMKKLKIKIAFLSMNKTGNSYLKIGRIDHNNILKKINSSI